VTRGELGTTAAIHDDDAEVETFFRLTDDTIPLALKIMLSGANENFVTGAFLDNYNVIDPLEVIQNSIWFNGVDVQLKYGIVVGDFVDSTGADEASNNFTGRTITSIVKTSLGSYIIVDGADLVTESGSPGTLSFKSQYAVLPDGCDMDPQQVDVVEFERIQALFSTRFPSQDIYLTETENAKELINLQILYTAGLVAIPRGGKASLNIFVPPLVDGDSKTINNTNITNAKSIKVERSTSRNFYNAIIYQYEESPVDAGKFLAGNIVQSADSTNRIKIRNKPLIIAARI